MCTEIDEGHAFLVHLDNVDRDYLPSPAEIIAICNLLTPKQFDDGIIFGFSE
jgi:hypothetical protein